MGHMEDKKKYVKAFNSFHFNSIKAVTGLTSTQLAHKLDITYQAFVKIQNTALQSPLNLKAKTYKSIYDLIEGYGLTFPEDQMIVLDIPELKDKKAILTSFQYKTAIQLLYKRSSHIRAGDLSFLDSYFHSLKNHKRLEDHTTLTLLLARLKELFELKGLQFPNSYTIQISKAVLNPSATKRELEEIFTCYLSDLMQLEFKEVELLECLIYLCGKQGAEQDESFKVDYKHLIKISSFSSVVTVRVSIANLEKLNFLTREIRALKEGGILQTVYIKLNFSRIRDLQQLLPTKLLTFKA